MHVQSVAGDVFEGGRRRGLRLTKAWASPMTPALAGIKALADFIREIGLPASFTEMGIDRNTDFRAVADSTNITAGCCKS